MIDFIGRGAHAARLALVVSYKKPPNQRIHADLAAYFYPYIKWESRGIVSLWRSLRQSLMINPSEIPLSRCREGGHVGNIPVWMRIEELEAISARDQITQHRRQNMHSPLLRIME